MNLPPCEIRKALIKFEKEIKVKKPLHELLMDRLKKAH